MDEFERLLLENRRAVERFVRYKIPSAFDADDVLQETYIAAGRSFDRLESKELFKAWILGIARNKLGDYYRSRARQMEIPSERIADIAVSNSRHGIRVAESVRETIGRLSDKDRQILYYCFFLDLPQAEIAARLGIPLGTVKSRLHTAKQNFKARYPYPPSPKGETSMKQLPEKMPAYTITPSDKPPFPVVWEELMGWFIVPKLGEKLSWAMYDMPGGMRTEYSEMEVIGKAEVHGIEGVELTVRTYEPMDCNAVDRSGRVDRTFVAQLTDTHCRYLAESHTKDDVKRYYTFLDGDDFLCNWGFGENNCGHETHLSAKGCVRRSGSTVTVKARRPLLDIVGRYDVTIGHKTYDTVCLMDIETYNNGVVSEQYVDKDGKTVLWRRFNRDGWTFDNDPKLWSELLPNNEQITVNGQVYVHWYDCLTDHIV